MTFTNICKYLFSLCYEIKDLGSIALNFAYRTAPVHETKWVVLSEIWAGMAWWWIFWNAWHDYEHITGHYPDIRPIDWSDEELGIPPD
ncbi:hypothetical protein E2986_10766 [Frieseomelitta varia]|uniref:NADH dehydrogenase [ubiquinone] 1 beta subcomplex subunit 2, mitochondrial n=1 Tax=Frieseomelitta varia TaxID=561572 RepID=A0A833VYQ9_9HYME|nr:hypothetical protein E2986_10766 [Frieseomelitta varia]